MRTKNILGFDKMLEVIKNWQPDYSKVVLPLKTALIKVIGNPNGFLFFYNIRHLSFYKTA
jgi:hypothetical protein